MACKYCRRINFMDDYNWYVTPIDASGNEVDDGRELGRFDSEEEARAAAATVYQAGYFTVYSLKA